MANARSKRRPSHAGNGRQENGYKCEVAGLNYRMTNLQAAIGCAQAARGATTSNNTIAKILIEASL